MFAIKTNRIGEPNDCDKNNEPRLLNYYFIFCCFINVKTSNDFDSN